ncbi:Hypp4558 [Branchiostoma lanceolatum]|uniref:Hypp4558 protein n=1 Tax=Branchiostoma lanceolatum TaxID=7740 RepID=A0A8K0ABU5_BRALA|nr:Hypp4558 [Branchiostoma lanceolatum]
MVALGFYVHVVLVIVFLRKSLCFLTEEEILRRVETNVNSPPVNNTCLTTHLIARYQVKVVLETSEGEDVELVFNGENTDKLSWFSKSRLLSSPWTDLPGETTNFFSIEGLSHERCRRSFFISHGYNGCPGDTGWMAVVEHGPDAICEWERVPSVELPGILYSNASTYVRWSDESQLGRANRMVIYIKMCR